MIDSAPPLCAAVRGKLAEQENRIRKEFIDYDARRKPRLYGWQYILAARIVAVV